MMWRRSFTLGILMLGTLSVQLFAAEAVSPGSNDYITQKTERLKQELSLSDDQVSKIKDIMTSSLSANQTSPASAQDRQSYFQKKREQMNQVQTQIKSVLTDAQQQKYQELGQNKRNQFEQGGRNPGRHWNKGRENDEQNDSGYHGRHHRMHGHGQWQESSSQ